MTTPEGMIEGAVKRRQSGTADWHMVDQDYLDGVNSNRSGTSPPATAI